MNRCRPLDTQFKIIANLNSIISDIASNRISQSLKVCSHHTFQYTTIKMFRMYPMQTFSYKWTEYAESRWSTGIQRPEVWIFSRKAYLNNKTHASSVKYLSHYHSHETNNGFAVNLHEWQGTTPNQTGSFHILLKMPVTTTSLIKTDSCISTKNQMEDAKWYQLNTITGHTWKVINKPDHWRTLKQEALGR